MLFFFLVAKQMVIGQNLLGVVAILQNKVELYNKESIFKADFRLLQSYIISNPTKIQ